MNKLVIPLVTLMALSLTACGESAASNTAGDREFPSGPMTLLVGYAPGSSTDAGARLMAQALEEKLGTSVTVENKEGAGGQVGLTALAQAKCDGTVFGTVNFPSAIVSVLDEARGATYTKDSFAPVALQTIDASAIAVATDSPYQTIEDLVDEAKANPDTLRVTTTGVASNEHFALLGIEEATGASFAPVHFPDGGGGVKTAFLGGEVEVFLANVSDVVDMEANGQGRILGVMESERSTFLPDIPTFEEAGYDLAISSSRGYAYPECVDDESVDQLSTAMSEIMEEESFQTQMKNAGLAPTYKDSTDYGTYWEETNTVFSDLFPLVQEEQK